MALEFEWNEAKNLKNIAKHDISFPEAKLLFLLPNVLIESTRNGEERYILVAQISPNKFVSVVFTPRNDIIRIISARVSKKKEIQFFVSNINN